MTRSRSRILCTRVSSVTVGAVRFLRRGFTRRSLSSCPGFVKVATERVLHRTFFVNTFVGLGSPGLPLTHWPSRMPEPLPLLLDGNTTKEAVAPIPSF